MSDISTVVESKGEWFTTKTGVACAIGAAAVGLVWWMCSRKKPAATNCKPPAPAAPAAN